MQYQLHSDMYSMVGHSLMEPGGSGSCFPSTNRHYMVTINGPWNNFHRKGKSKQILKGSFTIYISISLGQQLPSCDEERKLMDENSTDSCGKIS